MAIGGNKKGAKLNKTKRGGEKQFSDATELERDFRNLNAREREEESSGEDDGEVKVANPAAQVIDISNPNRKAGKAAESAEPTELSRREREELQKEQAKEHYMKLQMEGKTDEARADLARLAIIRKQREEAKRKKEELAKAASSKKEEALAAGKSLINKTIGKS